MVNIFFRLEVRLALSTQRKEVEAETSPSFAIYGFSGASLKYELSDTREGKPSNKTLCNLALAGSTKSIVLGSEIVIIALDLYSCVSVKVL